MSDSIKYLPIIGTLIIVLSIYLCFKVKGNEKLLFLFAIVGFINISIGLSDGILKGMHVAAWQIPLRETVYNVYTAKSILLFLSILNPFLSHHWIKNKSVNLNHEGIKRKDNLIIAYIGTLTMYIILLMGYDVNALSGDGYVSNSNPLIEYAIVIFVVVWFYSDKSIVINILLKIYALLYVLYSMSFGDRSAAFLMILLYYLLYINKKYKLSITKIFILALIAITLSNFVAEYRTDASADISDLVQSTFERGLYSDTVSYSYYASITITAAPHIDDTFDYFIEYLKSLVVGGSNSEFSNLANFVSGKYFYNVGGGLYTSYFYFGFGYLGVIFGASILGIVLRKVYSHKGSFAIIYQLLIPVLAIRWYLYGPTSIYRSIFIVSTILLLICFIFDKLVRNETIVNNYVSQPSK
ncbi:O-antigen polysaccharide polymerase Wzy [Virgibacillus dakarensis]|nr:O-antigen polysaccharide polymerase Wzy [Virgibacillus dakarensis]